MRVIIVPDAPTQGKIAGQLVIEQVKANPKLTLGVATGSSPEPLYAELRRAYAAGEMSLEEAHAVALDEYVGIAEDHPERYRNVLRKQLIGGTGLKDENLHTPDGRAEDPYAAAAAYEQTIVDLGGVDMQILGIGANGHIGFNEPYGSLTSLAHVGELTERTRVDNARFFGDDINNVPTQCITQGLGTISRSRHAVLVANGAGKAQAIADLVQGAVSQHCPASILQMHPDVTLVIDEAAASLLKPSELFEKVSAA